MSEATGLVKYDAMCHAIAVCERVDEAKDIRDKALALEKYMAQAENLEAERLAINVRLRAERRCGVLLKEMKANGERASGHGDQKSGSKPSTPNLDDLGVSKDQSSRFQQLADVPDDEFEAALADPESKPSTAGVIRQSKATNAPPMDKHALWIWGRLRDFERDGILDRDPRRTARQDDASDAR